MDKFDALAIEVKLAKKRLVVLVGSSETVKARVAFYLSEANRSTCMYSTRIDHLGFAISYLEILEKAGVG
jgi:hypothetical protein